MIKKFFVVLLTIPVLTFAQDRTYPNNLSNSLWIGFGGGTAYNKFDFSKPNFGFYGRGELEYLFESYSKGLFGLKAFGGYGSVSGDNTIPLAIGSPVRNSQNFLTYLLDAGIGLSFMINFEIIKPYLALGGYSTYWYKVLDEARNEAYDKKRNISLGVFGEGGFKIKLAEGLTLNLSGTVHYPNTDEIDGRVSSKKDLFFTGLGGFSVYFGGLKDSDKDGIPDKFDMCPKTPPGIRVNKFGCPVETMVDSDGDGVEDRFDKCPDTPAGVVVDQFGCPTDSDGDGVPDYLDRCPGTPANFAVDEKGCPLDSDNDGVLDAFDRCPNTPKGVRVDDFGCPYDSDNDGVIDEFDKCPDTKPGVKVNSDGCPSEQKLPDESEQVFILQGMTTFELGKSKLTESAKAELKRLSEIMKKYPGSKWRIEGHTDSQGSSAFNKKLSQERANVVKNYLISLGVPANSLIAEGMGEDYPIADNKTEEGRQKNRRVVITKIK